MLHYPYSVDYLGFVITSNSLKNPQPENNTASHIIFLFYWNLYIFCIYPCIMGYYETEIIVRKLFCFFATKAFGEISCAKKMIALSNPIVENNNILGKELLVKIVFL